MLAGEYHSVCSQLHGSVWLQPLSTVSTQFHGGGYHIVLMAGT